MRLRIAILLAAPIAFVAAASFAQSPPAPGPAQPAPATAKPAAASTAAPKPAATPGSKEPRRDPEGKKGISPYMEAVARGQNAFVARDFPGAVTAFQDAIKLDPQQMLGFYLLGEAQLEAGKPEEAEAAWTTGLSKKGAEDLNAKLLFIMADLRERQKSWQGAKDAWAAYSAFVSSHPQAKGYAATAEERTKRIDQRMKDEKDYAAVKERIKKREEERLKEAAENAKKDKLNK
jgi:predicted Zn-dependent protease